MLAKHIKLSILIEGLVNQRHWFVLEHHRLVPAKSTLFLVLRTHNDQGDSESDQDDENDDAKRDEYAPSPPIRDVTLLAVYAAHALTSLILIGMLRAVELVTATLPQASRLPSAPVLGELKAAVKGAGANHSILLELFQ